MLGIEPMARGPSTRRSKDERNRAPGSVSMGAWMVERATGERATGTDALDPLRPYGREIET